MGGRYRALEYLPTYSSALRAFTNNDQRWVQSDTRRGWYGSMASILVIICSSYTLKDSRTCAAMKGIHVPHPADHCNFNSHPRPNCYAYQHAICCAVGCSVHNGVRDQLGRCSWCDDEIMTRQWHNSIPVEHKNGFKIE
jgi:hypothetical protein